MVNRPARNQSVRFIVVRTVTSPRPQSIGTSGGIRMAEELGCLDFIINRTLTCYNGVTRMNDYGMGCGQCPACRLRSAGYLEYRGRYHP